MTAYILQACLVNIFFITHKVETGCQQLESGIHVFGPSCGFMCHCFDASKCDDVTGKCTSGCADEWAGPGCQYRDVAKGKFAQISENLPDTIRAEYAIDGNVSTCTKLENPLNETDEKSWWRVWLPHNETIQGLSIITTADDESLPAVDFIVFVEKTQEYNQSAGFMSTSSEICYKQRQANTSTVSKNILCNAPIYGNQLRIELQSSNSVLNICDLRVFGGRNMAFKKHVTLSSTVRASRLVVDGIKINYWKNCSATTNTQDKWMMIDLQTRVKIQAFQLTYSDADTILNYTLEVSDDSNIWHFVYNDQNKSSPTTCVPMNVDARYLRLYRYKGNGRLVACEIEVFGDCLANTCGWDCSKTCHCDKLTESDISYGNCSNGCKGRWTGQDGRCNIECDNSSYGLNCKSSCSGNCKNNSPCNMNNGYCDEGCAPGWIGEKCDTECPDGKYGNRCTKDCSRFCRNSSVCRKTDGHCFYGCTEGFIGEKCSHPCQNQTYGLNCAFNCSGHCLDGAVCMHTNGTCMTGCEPGWTGDNCEDECPDYTYGPQCKYNCSTYCKNNTACSKTSGYCTDGCEPGNGENYCKEEIVKNVDEQTRIRQAYIATVATVAVCVLFMAVVTIVLCWKKNALVGRVCPKFRKRGESFFDNAVFENTQQKRDAYSHETLDMQLEYLGINTKISETDACGTDQVGNFYETLKGNTDVGRTYEKYEDLTG